MPCRYESHVHHSTLRPRPYGPPRPPRIAQKADRSAAAATELARQCVAMASERLEAGGVEDALAAAARVTMASLPHLAAERAVPQDQLTKWRSALYHKSYDFSDLRDAAAHASELNLMELMNSLGYRLKRAAAVVSKRTRRHSARRSAQTRIRTAQPGAAAVCFAARYYLRRGLHAIKPMRGRLIPGDHINWSKHVFDMEQRLHWRSLLRGQQDQRQNRAQVQRRRRSSRPQRADGLAAASKEGANAGIVVFRPEDAGKLSAWASTLHQLIELDALLTATPAFREGLRGTVSNEGEAVFPIFEAWNKKYNVPGEELTRPGSLVNMLFSSALHARAFPSNSHSLFSTNPLNPGLDVEAIETAYHETGVAVVDNLLRMEVLARVRGVAAVLWVVIGFCERNHFRGLGLGLVCRLAWVYCNLAATSRRRTP